ncbi:Fc.00g088680.m01.CDS01 [Cosmosporella sp. VM-42]
MNQIFTHEIPECVVTDRHRFDKALDAIYGRGEYKMEQKDGNFVITTKHEHPIYLEDVLQKQGHVTPQ